ncbi:MAG: hypothetical protein ACRC10_11755 [Thermoguttaceae bacterium]
MMNERRKTDDDDSHIAERAYEKRERKRVTFMKIEILNPEARNVLQSLSKMKLIAIDEPSYAKEEFKNFIQELQSQSPLEEAIEKADEQYAETFQRLAQ